MSEVKEFQEFPKWIYHKDLPARMVNSKEEQDMWGEDWKESPAEHIKEEKDLSLEDMTEEEIKKIALEKGVSKKKVKELSKEQIITLLKGDV